ncbi:MAG: fimbrillin family protein [Prevotella sp.]|nr:fimbrillin family protein [Prevotella sp.]
MKKQLLFMAFMVLAAMNFASCSSSDDVQNEQGNQLLLSAGIMAQKEPYNIGEWGSTIDVGDIDAQAKENVFSDYGDSILTRTPTDNNNWDGMNNRNIAVQIGSNAPDKSTINANGSISFASPYYFTTTNNVSVTSWYPYSASLSTFAVQTDQTSYANYEASDLLYATTQMNQSSPSGTLTYSHKTAKVIVYVTVNNVQYLASDAITAVSMSNLKTSATVSNGNLTASDSNGTIKMYNNVASRTTSNNSTATFEACVIPQTAAIGLTINYCGTTYTTTLSSKTLTAGNQYTANVTITVQGSGTINGHAWVRLGSPLKWATMNVGASAVTGSGGYYQWGATTEYKNETQYWTGTLITPTGGHDIARIRWGGTWRMPRYDEMAWIINNCNCSYTTQNSVNGWLCRSNRTGNNNSIFIPICGRYQVNESTIGDREIGLYWVAEGQSNVSKAQSYNSYSHRHQMSGDDKRCGQNVRAVSD